MKSATLGIRELRNGLSRYIAAAHDGTVITVTDHGRPVARITRVESQSGLEALLREGIAQAPASAPAPLPPRIRGAGTVSDLVAEQRK